MVMKKYRIESGAIAADGTATADTRDKYGAIRGKLHAVSINYPSNACTVDLDELDSANNQKIVDLASSSTDTTIYPRAQLTDNTGANLDLSDGQGGDTAAYGKIAISGHVQLSIASGTQGDEVTVDLYVEE